MDDNEKRNAEKLDFFLEEKVKVHVEKKDRMFWNGFIVGKKNDGVFIIEENKLGIRLLFVADIWEVNEYVERGK